MKSHNHATQRDQYRLNRRQFFENSLKTLGGLVVALSAKQSRSETAVDSSNLTIKEYRILGRTGFQASDIGLGTSPCPDSALLKTALDAGINYIDTGEDYANGSAERTIGSVIKHRDRKSLFITTKLGLRDGVSKDALIARTYKCLERLQTDYVDCMMIHSAADVGQLKDEAFHAAIRELKINGRVRFSGVSCHGAYWGKGPRSMEEIMLAAIDDGRFDTLLFVYNFLQREMGENILKACQDKKIGATLMKSNPIGSYLEIKGDLEKAEAEGKERPSYASPETLKTLKERADRAEPFMKKYNLKEYDDVRAAAIKFVLSHSDVHSACLTVPNYDFLAAYVALSGNRLEPVDQKILKVYEEAFADFYCRHACSECEPECPHGVPVNTIMRFHHYFKAQAREKYAMVKYACIQGTKADKCLKCEGYCEQACPYGVPVQGLMVLAHNALNFV